MVQSTKEMNPLTIQEVFITM